MNDQTQIDINLEAVRSRLCAVTAAPVKIVLVTKGFGPEAMLAARRAGIDDIGENYVQELVAKLAWLTDHEPPSTIASLSVRMIGQLQTNKVRHLAGRIARYDTIDRSNLAREVARRDPGARVLIQVNTTGEPGKGGVPIEELDALVEDVQALGLDLEGLMTIGPTEGEPDRARSGFAQVRGAVDRLGLRVCSMGMSGDLEIAAAEGATEVRIGSAVFGPRTVRVTGEQVR